MAAEQSPLHCPDCGYEVLVIARAGFFCARCSAQVAQIPAASNVQDMAESVAIRLRARQNPSAKSVH
jgi:DNA-directed RNA polymerase subunit RPC12/RpoP